MDNTAPNSESKGRTAGFLLDERVSPAHQLTIRVGGPQAGHIVTGRDPDTGEDGYHWKLRSVPVGAVCREDADLAIASGSEVDPDRLAFELHELDRAGYRASARLFIDPAATWMHAGHKEREVESDLTARLGSTSTGVGAARCDRLMRVASTAGRAATDGAPLSDLVSVNPVRDHVAAGLGYGYDVLIEAAQGCHLDLHRGPYPFATSGRTTAIDALASAEVIPWAHPKAELQVWLAVRTFPIRVGGNSGPMRNETTWEAIKREPEITTVTKRVRRVGWWDRDQVRDSVRWCGGAPVVRLSLSHLDYLFPEIADCKDAADLPTKALDWINQVEVESGAQVGLIGVSPSTTLVYREDLL